MKSSFFAKASKVMEGEELIGLGQGAKWEVWELDFDISAKNARSCHKKCAR